MSAANTNENLTTKQQILEQFKITEAFFNESVDILQKWFETQKHLPEVPAKPFLEKFLILNKLNIEITKRKVDMYYTIRGIIPEFYKNTHPQEEHMRKISKVAYHVLLPKLNPDLYWIKIFKLKDKNPDNFNVSHLFAHVINIVETTMCDPDYFGLGEIIIYDLEGFSFSHFTKLTPSILAKMAKVAEEVYSMRIKGIHFIHSPSIIDGLLRLAKGILKPKLLARIHVHKDLTTLYDFVPKALLPSDLGGSEASLDVLNNLQSVTFDRLKWRFDFLNKMTLNEDLRPEKLVDSDILGFHGNFRKLNVD